MKSKNFITPSQSKSSTSASQRFVAGEPTGRAQGVPKSRRSTGLTETEALAFERELARMRGEVAPKTPKMLSTLSVLSQKPMSAPPPSLSHGWKYEQGKSWCDEEYDMEGQSASTTTPQSSANLTNSSSTTSLSTMDTAQEHAVHSVVTGARLIGTQNNADQHQPIPPPAEMIYDEGLGKGLGSSQLRLTPQGKLTTITNPTKTLTPTAQRVQMQQRHDDDEMTTPVPIANKEKRILLSDFATSMGTTGSTDSKPESDMSFDMSATAMPSPDQTEQSPNDSTTDMECDHEGPTHAQRQNQEVSSETTSQTTGNQTTEESWAPVQHNKKRAPQPGNAPKKQGAEMRAWMRVIRPPNAASNEKRQRHNAQQTIDTKGIIIDGVPPEWGGAQNAHRFQRRKNCCWGTRKHDPDIRNKDGARRVVCRAVKYASSDSDYITLANNHGNYQKNCRKLQ